MLRFQFPLAVDGSALEETSGATPDDDIPPGGRELGVLGWTLLLSTSGVAIGVAIVLAALSTDYDAGIVFASLGLTLLIYLAIDVPYATQVEVPLFQQPLYKKHGTMQVLKSGPGARTPVLIALFFPLAAIAISFIAVLPSLPTVDYLSAAAKGWICGLFAYGTLALVFTWTVPRSPLELIGIQALSGCILSCVTSVSTVGILSASFNVTV